MNSTFYGQPRAEVTRAWAARTPAGFAFSVKLFQKFTHSRMFGERVARGLPEELRGDAGAIESLSRSNAADLDEFRRGIEPLAARGRLGALLAQFPPSFKDAPAGRERLERLLRAFGDYPVAVELRHKSWSDRIGDTLELLNAFGAAWVQIDEPKFKLSIRQNYLPNIQHFYYMRLHGRNAKQWWRQEKSEDRYDYLYSKAELKEFTKTADAARRLVKKLYLYTNNHFSAKSVANAVMIKEQLGEPIEGEYSPEFAERYPDVADVIRVRASAESDLLARAEPAHRRPR